MFYFNLTKYSGKFFLIKILNFWDFKTTKYASFSIFKYLRFINFKIQVKYLTNQFLKFYHADSTNSICLISAAIQRG